MAEQRYAVNWQYKIYTEKTLTTEYVYDEAARARGEHPGRHLEIMFNDMGCQGWELVAAIQPTATAWNDKVTQYHPVTHGVQYIFKRPYTKVWENNDEATGSGKQSMTVIMPEDQIANSLKDILAELRKKK